MLECQLAGARSVEIELSEHETVIISATRYLPPYVTLSAIDVDGVVQVTCTRAGELPIVMREFTDWVGYTVRRAPRRVTLSGARRRLNRRPGRSPRCPHLDRQ
ncbi:MAG: hypothetical protein WCE30_07895 [Mycobacterium sp.]